MSTENTQSAEQNPTPPLPPEDLFVVMRRIRKNRPMMKLHQHRIARDLGLSQSYVSIAMRCPEKYPPVADRIYNYLKKLDTVQPTQVPANSAEYSGPNS